MPNANRAAALQVVDPLLTRVARRYQPEGFIYNQLVSDVPVQTFTGKYMVYTDQYWFQNEVDTRTEDRAPSKEIDFEWDTDTFSCVKHALKVSVTEEERQQAGTAGISLESDKVEYLQHRLNLAAEVRLATLLSHTGVTGGQLNNHATPSVNWDQDTATIEADIKGALIAIYDLIGIRLNTIVIPFKVAYAMALQQDIRDVMARQISGGTNNFLELGDRVLPATIHGLKVIIPVGAQVDAAREGGTASKSEIWGADVRLLYIDPGAGRLKPATVKRFLHTGPTVTRWRDMDPDVDYIRSHSRFDEKVVAPDAGYVLEDVL